MSVPKLRFKEFSGDWEEKNLGEMTDTITSGSRDWAKYYSDSGCKFIRMTNLNRDGIQLKLDDLRFVDIKSSSSDGERTSLVQGDILMSITAELGKIGWIPSNFGKAFINQHTALIRIKRTGSNSIFVAHLLSTKKLNKQINGLNDAGAKAGLNLPTIKSICLTLPSLPEQTKIANFLTAVDQKISLLTQKATLLSQYKKGVMQQIFSQELRFKDDDGQEFPEWEEKTLGDVFKVTRGNVLSMTLVSESQCEDNTYPVYSSQTKNNGLSGYFNSYLYEDSITWTTDGANAGDVNYRQGKFYCTNVCGVLINDEGYANACVAELINAVSKKFVSYVGNPKLMNNVMTKIEIQFPSVKEQTKIANFLTAVDEKITINQTQLNTVKQYKQGLLQQMFV